MGAGAIGSVIGGFLAKAGYNVVLVGRYPHIEAIRKKGLYIKGIWGDFVVKGFVSLYDDVMKVKERFDYILITVKSYDTDSAVRSAANLLKEDGFMASFQNGLGNIETIADIVGEHRTIGARVIFGAILEEPGVVKVTVSADAIMVGLPFLPKLTFEEARYSMERTKEFIEILNSAGISAEYTKDIMAYIWGKVLYNAALNPLSTILNVEYGKLAEFEETREIMDAVVYEIFQIAYAKGQKMLWANPKQYLKIFYEKLIPATYEHISSMLQDIQKGKKTEIDAINGIICRYGKEYNIPTPYNCLLTKLVKFLEYREGRTNGFSKS
jgi:2-dehydropantoate 2-reductase